VLLCVGRIGRAHGVRGEVLVALRTDDPADRFAVGSRLGTDPAERGPLQVRTVRAQSGGLVVSFDGIDDRTAAEDLRGTLLVVDSADLPPIGDPEEFRDAELIGLVAHRSSGEPIGAVVDVLHPGASDLLVLQVGDGEVLVPFVRAFVPTVDVAAGRLVVDPPEGLLEL
jgi:16S rRNA processing protein RimM